jgi:hypothetical protein
MTFIKTITATSVIIAVTLVSACATEPSAVAPTYVSANAYSDYSCSQLNSEAEIVSSQLTAATGRQQAAADNDATMTAVSLILFWPAAFFIKGDDASPELARLKGTAEAINRAAVHKGC